MKAAVPFNPMTMKEGFQIAYDKSLSESSDATAAPPKLFTPKSGDNVMTASTDAKESSKSSTVMNGGNSSVVNAPVINNNIIPSPIVNTNPLNMAGAYSSVPLNY